MNSKVYEKNWPWIRRESSLDLKQVGKWDYWVNYPTYRNTFQEIRNTSQKGHIHPYDQSSAICNS